MENKNLNVNETSQIVTMEERDMKKVTAKQRVVKVIVTILVYTFLFAVAISVLFPFYWMIISSLKS